MPPDWPESEAAAGWYEVAMAECQRVSVGPFERGPIHFMLETHSNASPPETCQQFETGFFAFKILRSIWIDDAEVAEYLRSTLGLPAILGEFSYEVSTGAAETRNWHWNVENGEASEAMFFKTDNTYAGSPEIYRYYWQGHDGVSILDLNEDTHQPLYNTPQSYAIFQAPMMASGTEFETSPGIQSLIDPGDYNGPIYRFGDAECKEPL